MRMARESAVPPAPEPGGVNDPDQRPAAGARASVYWRMYSWE